MQRANLLPLTETTSAVPLLERPLRVATATNVPAGAVLVRAGLRDERSLASLQVASVEVDLHLHSYTRMRLAPDNPLLDAEQRGRLDASGIVPPGTRVNEGDVLASVLAVDKTVRPKPGMEAVEDRSVLVPAGWGGAVVEAVRRRNRRQLGRAASEQLRERIEIVLRLERDLEIGDVLCAGEQTLGIVSHFVPDAELPSVDGTRPELLLSPAAAARLGLTEGLHVVQVGKSAELAALEPEACAEGKHSLISMQPLGLRRHPTLGTPMTPRPAEVTLEHVRWLRERGLDGVLSELVCLKSDDVRSGGEMDRVRTTGRSPAEIPLPGTPESLYQFRAYCLALGLAAQFDGAQHVTLSLRPATRDELLAQSSGAVTLPDTVHYRTLKEMPGGILCPEVFGRAYRFGHFELASPVVPYLWRVGTPSVLEQILELSGKQIDDIVYRRTAVRRMGDRLEFQSAEEHLAEELAALEQASSEVWRTGAGAIRRLLREVPSERLPSGLEGRADALVQDVVLLPPAFLRPVVLLDSGNFATVDLNDLYRQMINRSKRLAKLIELKAPATILRNERAELQRVADALCANRFLPEGNAILGSAGRPLVALFEVLLRLLADTTMKRVAWSAQIRVVAEPSLADDRVIVPRRAFDRLRLAADVPVLLASPVGGSFTAGLPTPGDNRLLRLSSTSFDRLGLSRRDVAVCNLHVPLGLPAIEEARKLMSGAPAPVRDVPVNAEFESDEQQAAAELVRHALSGEAIHFADPRGLLLAGLPPATFVAYERSKWEESPREIPAAPDRAPPTVKRMLEIARAHRRKACLFHVRRTDNSPDARAGRMGGVPLLPPDFPWPHSHGEPLQFIAQLPLDLLRGLDADRFGDFEPESLLTIFWAANWGTIEACTSPGPLVILPGENLAERSAAEGVELLPLCAIEPEIVEEVPCWSEMQPMLAVELDDPDPKLLRKFHKLHWGEFSEAREATKLGGWANWVQYPEAGEFLAQVWSEDEAQLAFVDGGSLYVSRVSNGSLTAVMQYY